MKKIFRLFLVFNILIGTCYADITQWMIDLSSHNAAVQVRPGMVYEGNNAEIRLIIHRLTIGRYLHKSDCDRLYSKRSVEARDSNIYFGAYHVAYPSSDATTQARGFLRAIEDHTVFGQPVVMALDWEHVCVRWNYDENGNKKSCAQEGLVPPSWVVDFVMFIERETNKKVLIYTSHRALRLFTDWFIKNSTQTSILTECPLWFARYHQRNEYRFPTESEIFPWNDWTFWQFGEGKAQGPTKKISPRIGNNPIDMNFFNGTRKEIDSFVFTHSVIRR